MDNASDASYFLNMFDEEPAAGVPERNLTKTMALVRYNITDFLRSFSFGKFFGASIYT